MGQNDMGDIVFGLHRRERIAHGLFSEKVVPWHRFGGPTAPLGGYLGKKAVKFGRSGRSCCRSYGNHRKPGGNQVKAEVKVYLTDKSYD